MEDQRLILDLAFQEQIAYDKENGFGIAELSLSIGVFTLSKGSTIQLESRRIRLTLFLS